MNNERVYYSHDAEIHAMRARTTLSLIFLMFGLVIGAGVVLLFSPISGKKARHQLTRSVEQGLKDGREVVEPVIEQVEKEFGEMKKNIEERLR